MSRHISREPPGPNGSHIADDLNHRIEELLATSSAILCSPPPHPPWARQHQLTLTLRPKTAAKADEPFEPSHGVLPLGGRRGAGALATAPNRTFGCQGSGPAEHPRRC